MSEVKMVGRGVDTLVLNVCYTDKQFQPIKQELAEVMQSELNLLQGAARLNEAPVISRWVFKGINLFMQEKGSRGQWRWILNSPLLSVVISHGRLSRIIAQVRLSSGSRSQRLKSALIWLGGISRKRTGKSVLSRMQLVMMDAHAMKL
jgi:hypothetical protein